jgi:hypothetical protein
MESSEYAQETAKEKNGQGATSFHGPNLHRPLEKMTFETLGGAGDCGEASLVARPS